MTYDTNRKQRTEDAFGQFTRYSDGIATDQLADVLDELTDINDDIENGRHESCIKEGVEKAKVDLDAVYADYVRTSKLPFIPSNSSDLEILKYREGILKSTIACVIANADALQKVTHSEHRDSVFAKVLNDLETEIGSISVLIKRIETVGH